MRKIKFQGGITKLISSKIGKKNKQRFASLVDLGDSAIFGVKENSFINIEIVSFSSSNDFYEQILSILSFVRFVGVPELWLIYSDGSHSSKQIELLQDKFKFINVVTVNVNNTVKPEIKLKDKLLPYKEYLLHYAKAHPLGKRLLLYLNYDIKKPTLFLDSDILFYKKASEISLLLSENVSGWFLPDESWGCLDSRYNSTYSRQLYQVNGGFLLIKNNFTELQEGLEFLKLLDYKYEYFSEQTVIHIILKRNQMMPLDPRTFILSTTDQFDFSYSFPRDKMAIRHYTGPVRHKMWQRNWKWHLSLS